jgi:hypothetical protein
VNRRKTPSKIATTKKTNQKRKQIEANIKMLEKELAQNLEKEVIDERNKLTEKRRRLTFENNTLMSQLNNKK